MIRAKGLALALALAPFAPLAVAVPPAPAQVGPGYDIEMSRMIPMRDGVQLEPWVFKPSHLEGRAPAVLELTQYDIDGGRDQLPLAAPSTMIKP